MTTTFFHAENPVPSYRIGSPNVGRSVGIAGSAVMLAFGYLLFVPFADTTVLQYAAGPCAVEADGRTPATIVRAVTGRSWGSDPAAACARFVAASVPPMRLAAAAMAAPQLACSRVASNTP